MSYKLGLGTRHNADVRQGKRVNNFCMRLIKHSQNRALRLMLAGSRSEIPGQEIMFEQYGLNLELLDSDHMMFNIDICAFPLCERVPSHFNGQVVRIYSHGFHAGYVKLCYGKNHGNELQRSDLKISKLGIVNGPANTLSNHEMIKFFEMKFDNPDMQPDVSAGLRDTSAFEDQAPSIHCPYWPMEAYEWITRLRSHGVPSKSTVEDVVGYGCDFVQVSHKLSAQCNNEWRFSFSKAEFIIINSWPILQRTVYRTLHILCKINKSVRESTILCTYYFKTLMLWETEKNKTEFWIEDNLVDSVCQLLHVLVNWLRRKWCPNYFIPDNNMMDHLIDMDLTSDINSLLQLACCKQINNIKGQQIKIYDILVFTKNVEVDMSNRTYSVEAPTWLHASLALREQLIYSKRKETKLFTKHYLEISHVAFSTELCGLYCQLKDHHRAAAALIPSDQDDCYGKSITSCECCRVTNRTQYINVPCSKTFDESFLPFWLKRGSLDLTPTNHTKIAERLIKLNANHSDDADKKTTYDKMNDNTKRMHCLTQNMCSKMQLPVDITIYITTTVNQRTVTRAQVYEELPGASPTVNISWFANKAYHANFYYNIQNNQQATKEMCDDIVDSFKQSMCNHSFAESIPVILSTDWASIYDDDLQAVIGLYSLCCMFDKTDHSRSVYLGVCPIVFALYLKHRCVSDQIIFGGSDDFQFMEKCAELTLMHLDSCSSDKRVSNGSFAILSALITRLEIITNFTMMQAKHENGGSLNRFIPN